MSPFLSRAQKKKSIPDWDRNANDLLKAPHFVPSLCGRTKLTFVNILKSGRSFSSQWDLNSQIVNEWTLHESSIKKGNVNLASECEKGTFSFL